MIAKVAKKVINNYVEGEAVEGTSFKTLAIDVDMVRFIPS